MKSSTFPFQTEPYRVRGCVLTVVERMDEEFTKMLQACDAHSTEYVDRYEKTSVSILFMKLRLVCYFNCISTHDTSLISLKSFVK